MKKIIVSMLAVVAVAVLAVPASADEKESDRKEKPSCYTYCDTCYRCVEPGDRPTDPCKRTENYQCNCREVCN